jgi:DNA-binding MarR family transcriptional regulator
VSGGLEPLQASLPLTRGLMRIFRAVIGEVKATGTLWEKLGIHRKSAYRGLSALEAAGLITIVRHAGRAPIVTILEVTSTPDR